MEIRGFRREASVEITQNAVSKLVAVWEVIGYYYLKTRQTLQSKILARSTPLVGPNLKGTNFYYGDFNARYFFVNVYRFIQAIFSQLQYFPRFISGFFASLFWSTLLHFNLFSIFGYILKKISSTFQCSFFSKLLPLQSSPNF